jgi:hypothetical protein
MSDVYQAFGHWSGGYCGNPETRRYINGWRCTAHTPASVAGRTDIQPDPGLTLAALQAKAAARYADCRADLAPEFKLHPQMLARLTDTMRANPPSDFDTAHAAAFLDCALGDCNSGLISICWLDAAGHLNYSAHQWAHQAAEQAAEWNRKHKPIGIFFRVTMLPPDWRGKRGGANDSHMFPMLWADVDYGDVGHKPPAGKLPLPPTEDDARKIITDIGETPTYLIHSGGGLYPLWQFDRPPLIAADNLAEIKDVADQWQKLTAQTSESHGYHYGQVKDLSRVLRLPGSINRKSGLERPCRVIEASGVLHPWEPSEVPHPWE